MTTILPELRITDVQIRSVHNPEVGLKAFANIVLNGCFVVKGFRVMQNPRNNHLFVFSPNRKNDRGVYKDSAYPINEETRQYISKTILAEYNKLLVTKGD